MVYWSQGKVQSTFIPLNEKLSIINLKKGIASLFQFQLLDQQLNETDSSGKCFVSYKSTGPNSFVKQKTSCRTSEEMYLVHPDDFFSVTIESQRESNYKMVKDSSCIESVEAKESHIMTVNIRKDGGSKVNTIQHLKLEETSSFTPQTGDKLDDIVTKIGEELNVRFTQESLLTERETKMCQDSNCPGFEKMVNENLVSIRSENFGKVKGATGFLRILEAARRAKKDEIYKVLTSKKYKEVL